MEERKGKGERWVLIMKFEKMRDKEKVLEKGEKIGKLWRMGVDENLTMEEEEMKDGRGGKKGESEGKESGVNIRCATKFLLFF